MGKQKTAKKAESGNQVVNPQVLAATERIKVLCAAEGIEPTNKYAVLKDLRPEVGHEHRFTSWAKNKEGHKGLVVLNTSGDGIKFYPNATEKFPTMRTINC
jgi:hypothetical protein